MASQQDDFTGGIVTDRPPYALRGNQSPLLRDFVIDDDGTLLALPWKLPRMTQDLATTFPADTFQRSDVAAWHDEGATVSRHPAPVNYRLTSPNVPLNSLYIRNNGLNIGTQDLPGQIFAAAYKGCSNFVSFFDDANQIIKQYVASFGYASEPPISFGNGSWFVIRSLHINAENDAIVALGVPNLSTPFYVDGPYNNPPTTAVNPEIRFPIFLAVYFRTLVAAGDYGPNAMMSTLIRFSRTGTQNFGTWDPLDSLTIGKGKELAITGLNVMGDSLMVPNTAGVCRIVGLPESLSADYLMDGYGCIAPNSRNEYKGRLIYLSPEGFVAMHPSGSHEMLTDKIKSRVKSMVSAQAIRSSDGVMERLGGTSIIHNDRLWYAWPNESEIWCYDFRYNEWTFHDQRTVFSGIGDNPSTHVPYVIMLAASQGKWPILQYKADTAGLSYWTKTMGETHRRGSLEAYRGKFDDAYTGETFVLPTLELGTFDNDRSFKTFRSFSIDAEIDWTGDSTPKTGDGQQNVWCIEILNESNDSVARAYFQARKDAQKIQRFTFKPAGVKPGETFRARIFSGAPDLDRNVSYRVADSQSGAACPVFFRIHAVRWEFEGDPPDKRPADSLTPVFNVGAGISPNYKTERFNMDGATDGLYQGIRRFPWALKTTAAAWNFDTDHYYPSSLINPAGSGLVTPVLDGYDQWMIEYQLSEGTISSPTIAVLALFNDFNNLSIIASDGLSLVNTFSPLMTYIVSSAFTGNAILFARWYEGIPGSILVNGATANINISTSGFFTHGTRQALRITRVPRTSTFYIDVSDSGAVTFQANRTVDNRIVAHLPSYCAQVPLNPYISAQNNGATLDTARVFRFLGKPIRQGYGAA